MTPETLLAAFPGLRLTVIGEAMLDLYVEGGVTRLCREAPVPIVAEKRERAMPGGAANAAANARALGAQVRFLSAVGQDRQGEQLAGLLADAEVDCRHLLSVPGRATLTKQRILGNDQLLLRLDRGDEQDLDALATRKLADALGDCWDASDAIILSDYGYGILTPAILAAVAGHQRRAPRILVGDSKHLPRLASLGLTAAKPNYGEALALVGAAAVEGTRERVAQMLAHRAALEDRTGAEIVAVTLDVAGAVVLERGCEPYRTFTRPAPQHWSAGAGDCFTAAFALALAAGAHTPAAADLASAAATACVATGGTALCPAAALREQLDGSRKRVSEAELDALVARWRAERRRIVFTNGCFDILHHGHISYLNRAKAMGDVLIVGLNSDASVRGLKGPTRPVNPEADRAAVLAALSAVDLVLPFEEPTPAALIARIRPDLYVKGGDYRLETLPEAPLVQALGGEVKLLPFLDDRSTTGIIERIRASLREAG